MRLAVCQAREKRENIFTHRKRLSLLPILKLRGSDEPYEVRDLTYEARFAEVRWVPQPHWRPSRLYFKIFQERRRRPSQPRSDSLLSPSPA